MENTQNTALLVMDMQTAMLGLLPNAQELVGKLGKAIEKARAASIPVIYVVVGFRTGAPEVSPNNKGFTAAKERFGKIPPEVFMAVAPEIAPKESEVTVVKRRVSAFTGSDLEVVLRAQGIQHIVLTGIATSGVVLSTTREAADKDYRITILANCCADPDEEVHQLLITKLFPRQADVLNLEDWK